MLNLKVGNIFTDIEGVVPAELYSKLQRDMAFRPLGYEFSTMYNKWILDSKGKRVRRMWDGWRRQIWKSRNRKRIFFPTGLLSLVKQTLDKKHVEYQLVDCRIKPKPEMLGLGFSPDFTMRDYQKLVINDACSQQRGIIQLPTGSGKTSVAGGIIQKLKVKPFIFFVTSIDLLLQAKENLENILRDKGERITVGQIGGGVIDIRDINVMTVQTAVRSLGEEWDKDYKFDSCDQDDKTPIHNKADVLNLLKNAKGSVSDECLTGNSIVITKNGIQCIKNLSQKIGEEVLSFSGNSVVWKKITNFYKQGKQKTVRVTLSNGVTLRCTADHLIQTNNGWRTAGSLHQGEKVLCCANVGADNVLTLLDEVQASIPNLFSVTKLNLAQLKNGKEFSKHTQTRPRFANAGVDSKLNSIRGICNHLLPKEAVVDIGALFLGTIRDLRAGKSNFHKMKRWPYLGHCSEIHLCLSRQKEAQTQGCTVITDSCSQSGRNLSPITLQDYQHNTGNTTMGDTEIDLRHLGRLVTQKYSAFTNRCIPMEKNKLQSNGWTKSALLDLHGGYVTTDRVEKIISKYIPKVSQKKKFISSEDGSQKNMDQRQYMNQEDILPRILKKKQERKLFPKSKNTSPIVCDINYVKVKSISFLKEEDVFDITVEDTHCFFANGMLVHNCQHWKAETCQLVARSLENAYYTYGTSATPYRDDGDDMIIQGCFGKKIAQISASQLIRDNWLVRPSIKIVHVRGPKSKFRQWQQLYKDQVTENVEYNKMVASIANSYIKEDRLVLVLVQQIKHGKILSEMIPGSVFLSGSSAKNKRQEGIDRLREREISCIVSTVIFDEGIDVKPLDTILLAGQGRSKVRAMQRIGRILRPFPGKTVATAVDFRIHQKYLLKHSIAREKMYRTEEEYQIEEIDANG